MTRSKPVNLLALPLDDADQAWVDQWRRILTAEEAAAADRLRDARDRLASVASKALVRLGLAAVTGRAAAGIVLARDARGKPLLPEAPGVQFSVSHTRGLVALALHDQAIGCDAEPVDRVVPPDAIEVLAAEEIFALRGLQAGAVRDLAFLRLWTVKEAYAKAKGFGLAVAPSDHAFAFEDRRVVLQRAAAGWTDRQDWRFSAELYRGRHVLAVAACQADTAMGWTAISAAQLAHAATGRAVLPVALR